MRDIHVDSLYGVNMFPTSFPFPLYNSELETCFRHFNASRGRRQSLHCKSSAKAVNGPVFSSIIDSLISVYISILILR